MSALRGLLGEVEGSLVALTVLGRLSALALLGESSLAAKRDRGRDASCRLEQAMALQDFLARHFQVTPRTVTWPEALRPDMAGLIANGAVDLEAVQAVLERVAADASTLVAAALSLTEGIELLAPTDHHLRALQATLPAPSAAPRTWTVPARAALPRAPVQSLRGPIEVGLDPIFVPTFSLLDRAAVSASSSHRAPLFWNLALREAGAAELCALSIVEHDGLPLAFHRDFAKQAWDETRHARMFLEESIALLPEFLNQVPADHPLVPAVRRFLAAPPAGLPVPLERSLYETIWNCSLEERLVLLHIDTEASGVAGFHREVRGAFCKAHPRIAARLEIATHDEASHARLGKAWLAQLIPQPAERSARIEETLLQRGVLILTAIARHQEAPLEALIRQHTG